MSIVSSDPIRENLPPRRADWNSEPVVFTPQGPVPFSVASQAVKESLRQRPGDQPLPVPNGGGESIHSLVIEDIRARRELGVSRYGIPLQAHNGRDALRDLYEELLDACAYIRQVIEERDSLASRCCFSRSALLVANRFTDSSETQLCGSCPSGSPQAGVSPKS
jgi:hypothetical protein